MTGKVRSHMFIAAIAAAAILVVGLSDRTVTGQDSSTGSSKDKAAKATILKTSWGAPDISGTWSNAAVVPFERPKQYGDREFKTDAEYKAAEDELLARNKLPGQDSREYAGKDARGTEKDVARAYNQLFVGERPTQVGRRTSLIIDPPDGKMPAYTSEALARITTKGAYRAALLQGTSGGKPGPISPLRYQASPDYNLDRLNRSDGPEDRANIERCLQVGLPVLIDAGQLTPDGRPYGSFGGVMRIVESPESVDMYYDVAQGWGFDRVIPITNRPHLPKNIREYWGDSIGHWEGATLVVDITNFTQETDFRGSRENLHLIERYKRVVPKTLQITITAEDPTTWVKPFTFVQELSINNEKANMVYEAGCHEGNHGLMDMIISTRAAERLFEDGKGPDPALEDNATGGETDFGDAAPGLQVLGGAVPAK